MNTPAHLILGAAAFAHPDRRGSLLAALAGALAPDLSLYLLAGWHIGILGTPAEVVFGELYYSEQWQSIFAIDNSVFVWGLLLGLAMYRRLPLLFVFAASALLHIALDLPLHAGDGRPHFWPLSDWVFHSPLSYWDDQFFGWAVGPAELALVATLTFVLVRRFKTLAPRAIFAALLVFEVIVSGVWMLLL